MTTFTIACGLLLNAFIISSFTSAFAQMDSKNQLAGKQLDTVRARPQPPRPCPEELHRGPRATAEHTHTHIRTARAHQVRGYLQLKAVPTELRARILDYYQYIFTSSQSMDDLQRVLHLLPPNLATQLSLSVNAKLISK